MTFYWKTAEPTHFQFAATFSIFFLSKKVYIDIIFNATTILIQEPNSLLFKPGNWLSLFSDMAFNIVTWKSPATGLFF